MKSLGNFTIAKTEDEFYAPIGDRSSTMRQKSKSIGDLL
jgi:hypothetical protein